MSWREGPRSGAFSRFGVKLKGLSSRGVSVAQYTLNKHAIDGARIER